MLQSPKIYFDYMNAHAAEFADMRHRIHQYPELGFEEFKTSDLVAERLGAWGYEVERGLGGTGVVGRLHRGEGARSIGLRADMDALPIQEETGLPYASTRAGLMHACGHDGHTAMLLGAAKYLSERGQFSGTLNLIFQPAEEGLGGATRMIEDGLFEKFPCDAIFAMHNGPGFSQGTLGFRDGATMASSDYLTVILTGHGGHGAMPHLATDPIVAAASIVIALQTVVSRNIDPREMAIVTVGAIHAGKANNVIPNTAVLEISMRSLSRDVRKLLEKRVKSIIHAQAESFDCKADIDFRPGYAVLVNSAEETEFARQAAKELLGTDKVIEQVPATSGSEDFAFMLEKRPGSYFVIGNGAEGKFGGCMVHNPGYDFNDSNLSVGAAYWAYLAEKFLR